jgi:hypothetical protein
MSPEEDTAVCLGFLDVGHLVKIQVLFLINKGWVNLVRKVEREF